MSDLHAKTKQWLADLCEDSFWEEEQEMVRYALHCVELSEGWVHDCPGCGVKITAMRETCEPCGADLAAAREALRDPQRVPWDAVKKRLGLDGTARAPGREEET